jgi:hypothetical protein
MYCKMSSQATQICSAKTVRRDKLEIARQRFVFAMSQEILYESRGKQLLAYQGRERVQDK